MNQLWSSRTRNCFQFLLVDYACEFFHDSSYVSLLIILSSGSVHTWSNSAGQNENIRQHLRHIHQSAWEEIVKIKKLKNWDKIVTLEEAKVSSSELVDRVQEPFTLEGFYERLVRWIVVDDQVCHLQLSCPGANPTSSLSMLLIAQSSALSFSTLVVNLLTKKSHTEHTSQSLLSIASRLNTQRWLRKLR